jgi:hypothetical protein
MINIDKSLGLIATASVTITEKRQVGYTVFLDLFNFYTNKLYTYQNLTIDFGSRIDTVTINLADEYDSEIVETGLYEYNFYQVISGVKRSCEKGLLRVVGETDITYQITLDETDDDYITYSP